MKLSRQERQQQIIGRLAEGSVSVQELVEQFDVSQITIRRDLALLERRAKLLRVHGGAIANERVAYEFSFKEKESQNREAKEAIGRAVAQLVQARSAVFVDTGTTALAAARALRPIGPSVIVTNNLCVASEYVGQRDVAVLIPGGKVGYLSPDLYGEWTLEALSNVSVDVALLGCDGVYPQEGYYSADPQSRAVSRLMTERSHRAYLLADSSKFGHRSLCRIASLDRLSGIVTDSGISPKWQEEVEAAETDLIVARV